MAIDHTNCTHPRTPAGRRACRAGAEIRQTNIEAMGPNAGRAPRGMTNREVAEIKMTGPVARRMARQVAKAENMRIQPRRSGARVSADTSSCVQAALHTRGKCACGWENWEMAS